jgi:hypothetical protein
MKQTKLISAGLLIAASAFAQAPIQISERPASEATELKFFRDGSNNIEYVCTALATQPVASWTRSALTSFQPNMSAGTSAATLTSIAVAANVGTVTTSADHGLAVGHWITVSGATVDTDLNGTYKVASVPTSTTFTIATASVGNATYTDTTLRFTSTAARENALIWAIRKMFYTSTSIDRDVPAMGNNAMSKSCTARASYF